MIIMTTNDMVSRAVWSVIYQAHFHLITIKHNSLSNRINRVMVYSSLNSTIRCWQCSWRHLCSISNQSSKGAGFDILGTSLLTGIHFHPTPLITSNYINHKVWLEIIYHSQTCDYLSLLELKMTHVSKNGLRTVFSVHICATNPSRI